MVRVVGGDDSWWQRWWWWGGWLWCFWCDLYSYRWLGKRKIKVPELFLASIFCTHVPLFLDACSSVPYWRMPFYTSSPLHLNGHFQVECAIISHPNDGDNIPTDVSASNLNFSFTLNCAQSILHLAARMIVGKHKSYCITPCLPLSRKKKPWKTHFLAFPIKPIMMGPRSAMSFYASVPCAQQALATLLSLQISEQSKSLSAQGPFKWAILTTRVIAATLEPGTPHGGC